MSQHPKKSICSSCNRKIEMWREVKYITAFLTAFSLIVSMCIQSDLFLVVSAVCLGISVIAESMNYFMSEKLCTEKAKRKTMNQRINANENRILELDVLLQKAENRQALSDYIR